ncbi:hypothetical protein [Maridesulfovibrio sp.]|uniref:GNAT family N-acetyltransferase n=1 Tax=Maridesulfovibrio sp. TaxID=2795000 RepID=UPI002A18CCD6|nr:hypothetical protein [Maridesulfovibrio sp.]
MHKKEVNDSNIGIFNNLMQNYEAEFSAITGKHPDRQGLYELDVTISEEHPGYLLYEGDNPIGFAVLGKHSEINDVAEFYIVPSFRRREFGKKFAFELFNLCPGPWQVRQIEGADRAKVFWRMIINEYTGGQYSEVKEDDPYWGPVTKQEFHSRTV